jgi:hypothetical protein
VGLSEELISQFAKITKDRDKSKKETTVYGTIVVYNGEKYVKLDGSEVMTPIMTTASTNSGDRVTVMIKNHTATVTGNLTSPSARSDDIPDFGGDISEFEIILADKVSTAQLNAESSRIDNLVSENVKIKESLVAAEADIDKLQTDKLTVLEELKAANADIDNLKTNKLDADVADLKYATAEELEATDADIHNLETTYAEFTAATTDKLDALDAKIENMEVENFDAVYANIDFSNISKATMEWFYAQSGLIKDVVIGDTTITGKLVGVTISGDLIEGNTIKAEKLVIKGTDGLYYKLNTDGVTTEA